MATISRAAVDCEVDYPTSDGRPMGETDLHRQDMYDVIQVLQDRFAADPDVYVTGNLLLYYEPGDRHRHVSPDVFVVRGVPKLPPRNYYLIWEEGKNPDLVIEITSKTTKREDQVKKHLIYRDIIRVAEYFQFDPTEDYLRPPMQGHRLVNGEYLRIDPVEGRLPSLVLGLHLERDSTSLRLYDPATRQWLLTPVEGRQRAEDDRQREAEARQRAEDDRQREAEARRHAEDDRQREAEGRQRETEARQRAEAEIERLRREIEALRRDGAKEE